MIRTCACSYAAGNETGHMCLLHFGRLTVPQKRRYAREHGFRVPAPPRPVEIKPF